MGDSKIIADIATGGVPRFEVLRVSYCDQPWSFHLI